MASGDDCQRRDPLVIVMAGKSGAGKSTFINSFLRLVGDKAAKTATHPLPVTIKVEYFESTINDIPVRVVDMPGLHALDQEKDGESQILGELSAVTGGKADLIFFCLDMSSKLEDVDMGNIDSLSIAFGAEIWKHVVIVLTKSDIVDYNGGDHENLAEVFAEVIQKELVQKRNINMQVKSLNSFETVDESYKFDGIVCHPTSSKPDFPKDWRESLFLQALKKCPLDKVPSLLKATYNITFEEVKRLASITMQDPYCATGIGAVVGGVAGGIVAGLMSTPYGAPYTISVGANIGASVGCSLSMTVSLAKKVLSIINARKKVKEQAEKK